MNWRKPCLEHGRYDEHAVLDGRVLSQARAIRLHKKGQLQGLTRCSGSSVTFADLKGDEALTLRIRRVVRAWARDLNEHAVFQLGDELLAAIVGEET